MDKLTLLSCEISTNAYCSGGNHTTVASCYKKKGHMSWCTEENTITGLPCGNRCPNDKGICDMHKLIRPLEVKEKTDEEDEIEAPGVPEPETNENEAHNELVISATPSASVIAPEAEEPERAENQEHAENQENAGNLEQAGVSEQARENGEPAENVENHGERFFQNAEPAFKKKHEPAARPTKKDKKLEQRQTKAKQMGNTLMNYLALKKRKKRKEDEDQD